MPPELQQVVFSVRPSREQARRWVRVARLSLTRRSMAAIIGAMRQNETRCVICAELSRSVVPGEAWRLHRHSHA